MFPISLRECVLYAVTTLAIAAPLAPANPADTAPAAAEIRKPTAPLPLDEQEDARVRALTASLPAVTAFRLDAAGTPRFRVDGYFGAAFQATPARLEGLLRSFTLQSDDTGPVPGLIVDPQPTQPTGAVLLTFFDPQGDVVLTFRRVDGSAPKATCSMAPVYVLHDANGPTGATYTYTFSSDIVSAVAGPNKGKSSDPDLALAYKTGSGYTTVDSSDYSSRIDDVRWWSSSCTVQEWRVRVTMYAGGVFSMVVHLSSSSG